MGYKAAVQVLKEADDLKDKVSQKSDLLNSLEAWTDQQKLQTIYHQVLILDLEYALDKKVEQDLWNIGFKNHISNLQELARDKKNPHRSDFQALLTWSLESASGFYLTLLQELCNTFDIDLPFRKRGSVYGQTNVSGEQINIPQTSSCLYICQYCLVHLGDIARYRNQRKQAENFYKQAILVSPTSGHPYNQLALLEASQGDKLSTVFYYIRGIAVKNPFPASTTNLLSILISAIDKDSPSEKIQTKMTVNEFIQLFLCTHGYFHTATELKQAELAVKSLNSIMTALVATQSFTKDRLVKITIINLYALKHVGKSEYMTEDEKKVRQLVLELIAGSLSAFLMPVHTLKMDESLLEYYALPAIKFLMYFIRNEPEVLKETVFKERLQIWPSLCKLINNNQKYLKGFNYNKYSRHPLSEDKDLQGFLPFSKNFKEFDFKHENDDTKMEKLLRMTRIVNFAVWLSDFDVNGNKLITKTEIMGLTHFDPAAIQPDPTNELLEEMRSFNIVDPTIDVKIKGNDRKAGILKPQGSLEKSREERETILSSDIRVDTTILKNNTESAKAKRSKQNIALQSIYKKMEESNKQVKFSVEPDKERSVKFDTSKQSQQQQKPQNPQQFNLPLRTQSFNQNHPAFPIGPPGPPVPSQQPDYLTNLRNMPIDSFNQKEPAMMPQFSQNLVKTPGFMPQSSFNNQKMPGNYQNNGAFTGQHPFTWNRDDMSVPPPNNPKNWWPNVPMRNQNFPTHETQAFPRQETQNFPRQDAQNFPRQDFPRSDPSSYPLNYPSYQNMPNYMQPNMLPQNKQTNNQYDVFNSPWANVPRVGFGTEGTNFENSQNISMRQAMLKEANQPGVPSGAPMGRPPPPNIQGQEKLMPQNQPAQQSGYSLFNNSWTPNLPGHLRSNKLDNSVPQHSLFGGHGPKSLAQLLEHQQNQLNKSDG